jgi:hypothetical protein
MARLEAELDYWDGVGSSLPIQQPQAAKSPGEQHSPYERRSPLGSDRFKNTHHTDH